MNCVAPAGEVATRQFACPGDPIWRAMNFFRSSDTIWARMRLRSNSSGAQMLPV